MWWWLGFAAVGGSILVGGMSYVAWAVQEKRLPENRPRGRHRK